MKNYKDYPGASMSFTLGEKNNEIIENTLRDEKITHVIETGTYLGKGSTKIISDLLIKVGIPQKFLTIEANWGSWLRAKKNLKKYSFVNPLWGKTVSVKRALNFIENDTALKNPDNYPDVFIDDVDNPIRFYSEEIKGNLGSKYLNPFIYFKKLLDKYRHFAGDNLLEKYLSEYRFNNPLILLDSAGGIGYLEFTIVKEIMGNNPYLLLLDDIHHLKHFRSLQNVQEDKNFVVIILDKKNGWVLAKHV